jgi:phage baseplate assembly protein W
MAIIKEPQFRDVDLTFLPHPVNRDVTVKIDAEAVKKSIYNLVMTKPYERFFHPERGSTVTEILFEPISPITAVILQKTLTQLISKYEPRAILDKVDVVGNVDANQYSVKIEFRVETQDEPLKLNFSLERLR